jgi:hypothetical protein
MGLDQDSVRYRRLHRRGFLAASAALGVSVLLPAAARAASIRELEGSVSVNGKSATRSTRVGPGDLIETGPGSTVVFVVGRDAFLMRERSSLSMERPTSSGKVATATLRLEAGALLAVFGKGPRLIETANATARIRGTGVYLEASAEQTYFCTCYGAVELRAKASGQRKLVVSAYHTPTLLYTHVVEGQALAAASVKDHTDAELIMLEALVGRTSPLVSRQPRQEATTAAVRGEAPGTEAPAGEQQAPVQRKRESAKPQSARSESGSQQVGPPSTPTPGPVLQPLPPSQPQTPPAAEELRLPPARLDD